MQHHHHHQQPNAITQPMMRHQNQYPNITTNMIIPLSQICSHCSSYILTPRKGASVLEISESSANPGAMDWLAFIDFTLYHLPNLARPAPTLCMKQSYQFPQHYTVHGTVPATRSSVLELERSTAFSNIQNHVWRGPQISRVQSQDSLNLTRSITYYHHQTHMNQFNSKREELPTPKSCNYHARYSDARKRWEALPLQSIKARVSSTSIYAYICYHGGSNFGNHASKSRSRSSP
jgi:hypothetical protein